MKATYGICAAHLLAPFASSQNAAKPAATSQVPTSTSQAPQAASPANQTVAQRHGKPQAKTKEEFADYNTDAAIDDVTAQLTAADQFAQKYPQSELRYGLYLTVMQKAYGANQPDKVIEAGRKVIAIEPEDSLAKIMVATALAETTHESDLDQDEKYAEAMKDADSAVKNIDNGLITSPDMTPERIAAEKRELLAMGNGAMGYIELSRKNYALSEQHFKAAIAANPDQPDASNFLRLAVAQDNLAHYSDAMASVDKALQLAQAQNSPQIINIAKNEKDRLTKLAASAPKSAPPPPKQ